MNTGEKGGGGKEVKGSHREEGGKKKEKKKKKISNCTRAHKCVVSNAWVVSEGGVVGVRSNVVGTCHISSFQTKHI